MAERFPRPPAPTGLFRSVPPAVFPATLGLLGLGVTWRVAAQTFGLPGALVEGYLGAATLVFVFAAIAYLAKVMRRPGALLEDARTLPGRAGLAAGAMCTMLLAAVLVPYMPGVARGVLALGLSAHVAFGVLVAVQLWAAAPEARRATPALHLVFVGVIVAPLAGLPLGWSSLSVALLWYATVVSLSLCALTLPGFLRSLDPAPLRPLHGIHLAPAGLISGTALATGFDGLAVAMLGWGGVLFLGLLIRVKWLTAAGFSGFWSAFTFPVTAFGGALILISAQGGGDAARIAGGAVLILATLVTLPIATRVLRSWADGSLAARTNAARA
ncbi:MAG: tellurium resistance protein [Pseudomonadota bacterium]